MARLPRLIVPGVVHVVSQRGLGSVSLFQCDEERRAYLAVLSSMLRRCDVDLHAYALLSDVVLLLLTPHESAGDASGGLSLLMQCLAREHVRCANSLRGRTGTLWRGRFQAAAIDVDAFGWVCWRFIEQAPVRSGLVASGRCADFPWSSAAHYAGRSHQSWLVDHRIRWGLGNTPFDREAAHRALLDVPIEPSQVAQIEGSVLRGWALGSDAFVQDLQSRVGRRLLQAARGRPRKVSGAR